MSAPQSVENSATVERIRARGGNPDHDYFHPVCASCGWGGPYYSNRTVEGRRLARRDAGRHRCSDEQAAGGAA